MPCAPGSALSPGHLGRDLGLHSFVGVWLLGAVCILHPRRLNISHIYLLQVNKQRNLFLPFLSCELKIRSNYGEFFLNEVKEVLYVWME